MFGTRGERGACAPQRSIDEHQMSAQIALSAASPLSDVTGAGAGHTRWVRVTHWIGAASVLTLAVTGFVILMAHPRLYWGQVGNDLTPALIELPVSRNYHHHGWQVSTPAFPDGGAAVSAVRTYDILNENSWARSLHFLAAWFFVVTGVSYLLAGIFSGHLRRDLLPRATELTPRLFWQDLRAHRAAADLRRRRAARRTTCCRSTPTASSCFSPCRS